MSEANGFDNNSFDSADILSRGLNPIADVEQTDRGEVESSYLDPIDGEIALLDEIAQNLESLEPLTLTEESELSLFSSPSLQAAITSNNPQPAAQYFCSFGTG